MKIFCDDDFIYIRQKPTVRTIFIRPAQNSVAKPYFLSFPYIQFEIAISGDFIQPYNTWAYESFKFFFSKDSSFSQLYLPPFPSINTDGNVCLGSNIFTHFYKKTDLAKSILQSFWSVPFSAEEGEWAFFILCFYRHIFTSNGPIIDIFNTWEEFTKLDPKFIFDIPYKPCFDYVNNNDCSQFNWIDWKDWIKE